MKLLVAVLALLVASVPVRAETYPSRTIKVVVPFPAGGGTDLVLRHFVERLRQRLGQAVVIENSGGGGGNPATGLVARSPADGYTLVGQTDQLVFTQFFTPNLPYDLFRDFVPISFLARAPVVLAVNPNVPAQTLAELLAPCARKAWHPALRDAWHRHVTTSRR
jgi:tripartite-type tricarboxylate transporter receptor subunit TctC